MFAKITLTAMTLLLAACATSPTPIINAKQVPPERILYRAEASGKDAAKAVFIRDTGLLGAGLSQRLFINDEVAALLDVGEKVEFKLEPGEYIFGVRKEMDVFNQYNDNSIDQTLAPGRTYYYRILSDGNTFDTRILRISGNQ